MVRDFLSADANCSPLFWLLSLFMIGVSPLLSFHLDRKPW